MAEREVRLRFSAEGADRVSNAISTIGTRSATTARQTKTLADSARTATQGFRSFGSQLLLLPTALVSTGRLIGGFIRGIKSLTFGLIDAGGQLADTLGGFKTLETQGINTVDVLNRLREATQGQVRDLDLQQIALAALGGETRVTVEQLGTLINAIFLTSKGLGRDFRPSLEALRRSLATGRLTTLAAIEGFESLTDKLEGARESARGQGRQISKLELLQIGLNEAIRASNVQIAQFGGIVDSAGDRLNKARVNFQNFTDEIKLSVATTPALVDAFGELNTVFRAFGSETETSGQVIGRSIGNLFAGIISFSLSATEKFLRFSAVVNDAIATLEEFADVGVRAFLGGLVGIISALEELGLVQGRSAESLEKFFEAQRRAPGFEEAGAAARERAQTAREAAERIAGARREFTIKLERSRAEDRAAVRRQLGAIEDEIVDDLSRIRQSEGALLNAAVATGQ